MVQVLNKILAIILALIVIFSSMSFTVEKHVCMDEVTDIAFFTEAESCGMEADECDTPGSDDTDSYNDEDCCTDISQYIPGTHIEQQAIDGFEVAQVPFIIAFTYTFLNIVEVTEERTPYTYYASPPVTDRDIQILYQTFLI